MKLEDVTAEIRPRAPWESIDLGCAIARQYIMTIWKSWFVTVVPMWIVLALLFRNHPGWFLLCLWWLKPLYDRILLFIVSRSLFGAVPSVKDVVKACPKLWVTRLWSGLVVRRFSPSRSLTMPVSELEGLKGKSYRQRVRLLEVNGGEGASIATFAGMILEAVAFLGVILLVFSMVPQDISERWWYAIGEFFSNDDFSEFSNSLIWVICVVWMFAITLMEPFYVSAGFALYINSRTLTEGWDIELALKRMSSRISNLKKGIKNSAVFLMGGLLSMAAFLAPSELGADQTIDEIMESEDFIIHTKLEKIKVEELSSWDGWDLPAVPAFLGNLFFVIVLAILAAGLAYLIYHNRHLIGLGSLPSKEEASQPKTREVMGMDVSPESLPDDVVSAARSAWEAGKYQLALSYLYRGSIVWLVNTADLPIEESDTEGDCLRHVEVMGDAKVLPYFTDLTKEWVGTAYGKQQPDDVSMKSLCDSWPFERVGRGDV